jgi:peroxiredoxin
MLINRLRWLALLCICAVSTLHAETTIEIPSFKVEMNVTKNADLGVNDKGVGLSAGAYVPDFKVNTHDGKPTSLDALLESGSLMVVFYRGGWCPYCNLQIRELTESWSEFQKRKITPVLISVDNTDATTLAQRTYEIPFPVLSDPDLKAHTAFDVVLDVNQETYKKYLEYGFDLEQWSGRDHHKMAVPAVFIVDHSGVIKWAHTDLDYKTRPSTQQLLEVIDGLTDEPEAIK